MLITGYRKVSSPPPTKKSEAAQLNTLQNGIYKQPLTQKLLLTKKYSEVIIFEKLRISRVIPLKKPSFLYDFEGTISPRPSKLRN